MLVQRLVIACRHGDKPNPSSRLTCHYVTESSVFDAVFRSLELHARRLSKEEHEMDRLRSSVAAELGVLTVEIWSERWYLWGFARLAAARAKGKATVK